MDYEKLRILEDHCIGTAESEIGFLEKVFLTAGSGEYNDIIRTPTGSPILLVGKKGTGKSAILQYYMNIRSKEGRIKVLYLKPDDIQSLIDIGDAQDIATIKRISYESLIGAISIKMGGSLKGLLPRKDKKLFDKAVASGSIHDFWISYLKTMPDQWSAKIVFRLSECENCFSPYRKRKRAATIGGSRKTATFLSACYRSLRSRECEKNFSHSFCPCSASSGSVIFFQKL